MEKEIQAKITFYDIKKCGYYDTKGKLQHSNTLKSFTELLYWHSTRENISESCVSSPSEESDGNTIYCYETAYQDTFLVTTWNGVPTVDGQVAAINGFASAGTDDIKKTNFPEGYIAGYETYFWILPRQDLLATIRVDKVQNGKEAFCRFMADFLAMHSRDVTVTQDDDGDILTTYGNEHNAKNLSPRFQVGLKYTPSLIETIRKRRPEIRKIIYKTNVQSLIMAEKTTVWQKSLDYFGLGESRISSTKTPIDISLQTTPNDKELEDILEIWESPTNPYSEVGFVYKGKSREIQWLGKSLSKGEFPLKVEVNANGIIDANSLLVALEAEQEKILYVSIKE